MNIFYWHNNDMIILNIKCIGQGISQPLLNRMDREYNTEMKNIFGTNYDSIHSMLLDTAENQLAWAKNINDLKNIIAVQKGSISSDAAKIIDTSLKPKKCFELQLSI